MKPRTKIQKEVWALYNKAGYLRNNRLSPAFVAWVEKNYQINEASRCGAKAWCSECGETFAISKDATEIVCPHCGKKLKVIQSRRKHINKDSIYVQELTTCGRWQVVKTYHVHVDGHEGWIRGTYIHRCYEKWVNEQGECVVIARKLKTFPSYQRIPWSFRYTQKNGVELDWDDKEVLFSFKNPKESYYRDWIIDKVYPIARFQPWMKRCGISAKDAMKFHFDYGDVVERIPNTPAETYWKQGQYTLVAYYMYAREQRVKKYGSTIKVARRHGLDFNKIEHMSEYEDYIDMLEQNGYDTHNPRYVAPADFHAAHQAIIEADMRRLEKEATRELEKAEEKKAFLDQKAQDAYVKAKSKFLGLTFSDKGLDFHVLQSIKEFYIIGKSMHICVYSASYFKHERSLILAATDENGNRVEIVEVDLEGWKIVQSKSYCNKASERHADIISIVNKNMGLIKKAARASA